MWNLDKGIGVLSQLRRLAGGDGGVPIDEKKNLSGRGGRDGRGKSPRAV